MSKMELLKVYEKAVKNSIEKGRAVPRSLIDMAIQSGIKPSEIRGIIEKELSQETDISKANQLIIVDRFLSRTPVHV